MHKILLLGANGLLGSRIEEVLKNDPTVKLFSTTRDESSEFYFDYNTMSLRSLLKKTRPDVVINCIVVTDIRKTWSYFFKINALLPIKLALIGFEKNIKILHFSTDAVFPKSSRKRTEISLPFPSTKYGVSKLLGDLSILSCIVIRTSFVGFSESTDNSNGLAARIYNSEIGSNFVIEKNILWNGITVDILAELTRIIAKDTTIRKGLFHLFSSTPILKIQLVEMLAKKLNRRDLIIEQTDKQESLGFILATSKDKQISIWWEAVGYLRIPSIEDLLIEMRS